MFTVVIEARRALRAGAQPDHRTTVAGGTCAGERQ
jgi:hypothetical protein